MEVLFRDYHQAVEEGSGDLLAATISPIAPQHYLNRLESIWQSTNYAAAENDVGFGLTKTALGSLKYPNPEINLWTDIYVAYWKAIGEIIFVQDQPTDNADWTKCYKLWKNLADIIIKGYTGGVLLAWTLPLLYMVAKHLRVFAIKADESGKNEENGVEVGMGGMGDDIAGDYGKNLNLEDAARVINRMFTLCISDRYVGLISTYCSTKSLVVHQAENIPLHRAPIEDSRKWGIYYITNLLFKTYFKLNSISLSKNILRALSASTNDLPTLDAFPRSHRVTFFYYVGVIRFLGEEYDAAETNLTAAYGLCKHTSARNKELILTYLIPTRMFTARRLPSDALLTPYPGLSTLFKPLTKAIRSGSLRDFDQALVAGEPQFVKRRIYLTLERARDICLRNLMRKVFLLAGVDEANNRRTRIKVEEFRVGLKLGQGEEVETDEVECLLSNMIYKVCLPFLVPHQKELSTLQVFLHLSFFQLDKKRFTTTDHVN